MYKILHEDAPALSDIRPELPSDLQEIVARAIHKDRQLRYKMGREMASDLAALFKQLSAHKEDISHDQKFSIVRKLRFFDTLSDSEVWEVLRASVWETYRNGDEIITEGNVDDSFFIIVSGSVMVCKGTTQISSLSIGDCFGEMGYLSKTQRSASIFAENDVSLLKINSSLMDKASLNCQLNFNKVFIKTLIERLTRTSERLSK